VPEDDSVPEGVFDGVGDGDGAGPGTPSAYSTPVVTSAAQNCAGGGHASEPTDPAAASAPPAAGQPNHVVPPREFLRPTCRYVAFAQFAR